MTDKELSKRMKAILNLAHYSTQVTLHIPEIFLSDECEFAESVQESIDCLLHDWRNDVNVVGDYGDPTQRVVDIKVIPDD